MISTQTPEWTQGDELHNDFASMLSGKDAVLNISDLQNIIVVLNLIRDTQKDVEKIEVFDVLGQAMLALTVDRQKLLVDWEHPSQLIPLTPEQQDKAPGSIAHAGKQLLSAQLLAFLLGDVQITHKEFFN